MGIVLQHISFKYDNNYILKDLSLEIKDGEHIGIVGESGSGKSTLLKIICGLYEATDGKCLIEGESNPLEIRKKVSVVMQNAGLLPFSIRDNITCGHKISEERLWAAVRAAQLDKWISTLPEGLDTEINERANNVSGGQGQRIAVARAIAKDASVILLDELASALDKETGAALADALENLTAGKTVIQVTHQEQMLKGYDRVLLLEKGRLYDK